jgi:hypothetical protein
MNTFRSTKHDSLLLSLGSFLFLISSGFSTYIRISGFMLILISFLWNIITKPLKISTKNLKIVFLFVSCYSIGIIHNTFSSEKTTDIYILTTTLILIFPLFIVIFDSYNRNTIDSVIKFISKSLIFIFFSFFIFLILVKDSIGPLLVKSFELYTGNLYFYYRPAGLFDNYPLIWTQASIFAMPLAIWHLFKNNYKLFALLSCVVFLSLNRTGSTLIIFLFLLKHYKFNLNNIAKFLTKTLPLLPFAFIVVIITLYYIYYNNFNSEYSGLEIRLGHVLSVVNNLLKNFTWVFGMGADSEFVSIGWEGDGITRDQEISYLEILRRFGLIGFCLFNIAIMLIFYKFYNEKNWPSFFSFLAFLIFSFTNPCLISFVFVLFISLIISAPKGESVYPINITTY